MTEMNLMPLGEQEYNELLLQAVAEIENVKSLREFDTYLFRNILTGSPLRAFLSNSFSAFVMY